MSRSTILAGVRGLLGQIHQMTAYVDIVNAAGSNSQANSTLLSRMYSVVASLSAVTTRGVKMPVAVTGMIQIIKNAQTTNLKLYPNTSAKLATGSANASASIGALKTAVYIARNRTQWDLILSIV